MKLQINKKVSDPKSAIFAVVDSLNYYIQPNSLKELNVPKLADQIVSETRRQYGESFTKTNLELILNQIVKSMTTESKTTEAPAKKVAARKDVQLTDEDHAIIGSTESFNQRVAKLPHLWNYPAVLAKAFAKSRQRVINAIKLAKDKQSK